MHAGSWQEPVLCALIGLIICWSRKLLLQWDCMISGCEENDLIKYNQNGIIRAREYDDTFTMEGTSSSVEGSITGIICVTSFKPKVYRCVLLDYAVFAVMTIWMVLIGTWCNHHFRTWLGTTDINTSHHKLGSVSQTNCLSFETWVILLLFLLK